jgi:hypothetical protein
MNKGEGGQGRKEKCRREDTREEMVAEGCNVRRDGNRGEEEKKQKHW